MSILTFDEACLRLRHSRSWLYKKTAARELPHLKIGGRVFFEPAELDRWLESQRVTPVAAGGVDA